jgi:MFS family permease
MSVRSGAASSGGRPASPSGRLAVFRNRNFTLLWVGSVISNSGSWMQMVAQGYLVYQLSGSPFLLGAIGVSRAIPFIILAPFGGVVADRVDRLKLLKVTQSIQCGLALLQAMLVATGLIEIWQIASISFVHALVNSFDQPTRSAVLPDLVRREDLAKAIALNSSAWQGSALFGPTIAGVVIASISLKAAFFGNVLGYLVVIAALYMMRGVPERSGEPSRKSLTGDFVAGLRYARSTPFVLQLLLISCVVSLSGRSYQQLLPAFSSDVLAVGPRELGLMMTAPGAGTVIGTAVIATMSDVRYKGRAFFAGMLMLSIVLAFFALNRSFPAALVLLFFTGVASLVFSTMMTTMLQLDVPPEMRGRIMALVSVSFQGMQPVGSLFTGAAASVIGIPEATFISAVVVGVIGIAGYLLLPSIRNYVASQGARNAGAWPAAQPATVAGERVALDHG